MREQYTSVAYQSIHIFVFVCLFVCLLTPARAAAAERRRGFRLVDPEKDRHDVKDNCADVSRRTDMQAGRRLGERRHLLI